MKNCDLCGKESFTEFIVKSKHLAWVLSDMEKYNKNNSSYITRHICKDCFKKIFSEPGENYTIEHDCRENRIEGGILSVSGSVSNELNKHCKWCKGKSCNCATCHNKDEENSYYLLHKDKFPEPKENDEYELPEPFGEKHYKPFEDAAELMVHYSKHFNIDFPPFYEPIIWVKRKDNDSRFLITGYDELDVFLEDCWQDLNELYEQYVFLDGSCIGKEE